MDVTTMPVRAVQPPGMTPGEPPDAQEWFIARLAELARLLDAVGWPTGLAGFFAFAAGSALLALTLSRAVTLVRLRLSGRRTRGIVHDAVYDREGRYRLTIRFHDHEGALREFVSRHPAGRDCTGETVPVIHDLADPDTAERTAPAPLAAAGFVLGLGAGLTLAIWGALGRLPLGDAAGGLPG
jgi:hypothetical protein